MHVFIIIDKYLKNNCGLGGATLAHGAEDLPWPLDTYLKYFKN